MQKKVWYYEKWVGRHASFPPRRSVNHFCYISLSLFELKLDGPMLSFPNQICKIIKLMIESDGNKKILWIILILTTFSFFKSAAQHTVGRVVYFLKPICYLWFVEICIRRKWACSPSLATTNNSPSLETDIRRIFSCRLCQAQYSQSVSKIATSSFLAHICENTKF